MSTQQTFRNLYIQVLVAIVIGAMLGYFSPSLGAKFQPLGEAFIRLIKMLIGPIIFTTVVTGIAGMGDMRKLGRVGVKALVYFEVVTTVALVIGLAVVWVIQPGVGINADVAALDQKGIEGFKSSATKMSTVEFLLHVIPTTFVGAFAEGEILQVLLISILFGLALARLGEANRPVVQGLHLLSRALLGIIGIIMRVAPLAAFGAMAFTIGKFGIDTLISLGKLMACVYLTCLLFIVFVLGGITWLSGFSLVKLLRYIREELLIVLGTSSSEAVLPRLMEKMERLGCAKSVVGIVLPAGYSFNLDGTCIYLTMAAIFVAQATNTPLTLKEELSVLAVLLLTSKGAAGVTGSGFITLAATLQSTGKIPVAGMALLLGVDRFMSEARAITNLIGNSVAMIVVAKWEDELDMEKARTMLDGAKPSDSDGAEG